MNISDALAETPVSDLDLTRYVAVPSTASVADTVRAMSGAGRSCALVVDDGGLAGIFTQRDVLHRVIGRPATWDRPITEEMSTSMKTMLDTHSVSDGLTIMEEWWVRSVPVLDIEEQVVGNLSFYVVMQTIADLLADLLSDDRAGPEVQHGLSFVDFTGLQTHAPVSVSVGDEVQMAAHQMKARGIGSVMVLDDRGNLVGVLTEFDLQMKLGVDVADLTTKTVGEVMTHDPVSLKIRSSVADAIRHMAEHGFSHVPLLGESGRPVAVVSFRDIVSYVETTLTTLS